MQATTCPLAVGPLNEHADRQCYHKGQGSLWLLAQDVDHQQNKHDHKGDERSPDNRGSGTRLAMNTQVAPTYCGVDDQEGGAAHHGYRSEVEEHHEHYDERRSDE
jgi:hypothetical protein